MAQPKPLIWLHRERAIRSVGWDRELRLAGESSTVAVIESLHNSQTPSKRRSAPDLTDV
jgi:hypothetical protein